MDSLETLLQIHSEEQEKINIRQTPQSHVVDKINKPKQELLKSEATMDLFQFIQFVQKLVNITMKDMEVEFIPEEGRTIIDAPEIILKHPIITYSIQNREIKSKNGLKPTHREVIIENEGKDNQRIGDVYGQKFESIVQFNIFASVYDVAEKVMKKLEELLFTYTGSLKKKGLGELIFQRQLTDTHLDQFRQNTSIRSIQYYVETEHVFVVFRDTIEDIEILGL